MTGKKAPTKTTRKSESKNAVLEIFQDPENFSDNYDYINSAITNHGKPRNKVVKDGRTPDQKIEDLVNSVQV